MAKTIVIGVGNVLFKDEGVGVYAARYLEANYRFSQPLEVMDGATLGFKLMTYFQEYDHVILIDTVSIEDTPGSIYRLPAQELLGLGAYRKTAHEVEVVEMLEICSLLDKIAEVTILGIVPQDIETVEIGLTPQIEANLPELVEHTVKELAGLGIDATPIDQQQSLETLVREFMGTYNPFSSQTQPSNLS